MVFTLFSFSGVPSIHFIFDSLMMFDMIVVFPDEQDPKKEKIFMFPYIKVI